METETQKIESNETIKPDQTKKEPKPNTINITELITTLKNLKTEEKELLNQRKQLETTENDLINQTIEEIENKKRTITGLKTQITFQQNKCSDSNKH